MVPVPAKGCVPGVALAVAAQIALSGDARLILRTDSEPAIVALKAEIAGKLREPHDVAVVVEDVSAGSTGSAANGLAEGAVREIKV